MDLQSPRPDFQMNKSQPDPRDHSLLLSALEQTQLPQILRGLPSEDMAVTHPTPTNWEALLSVLVPKEIALTQARHNVDKLPLALHAITKLPVMRVPLTRMNELPLALLP